MDQVFELMIQPLSACGLSVAYGHVSKFSELVAATTLYQGCGKLKGHGTRWSLTQVDLVQWLHLR